MSRRSPAPLLAAAAILAVTVACSPLGIGRRAPSPTAAPRFVSITALATTGASVATPTVAAAAPAPTAAASATPAVAVADTAGAEPLPKATPPEATPTAPVLAGADVWHLEPLAMPHPHGLAVLGGYAYTIDAGQVLAVPLAGGTAERLFPAGGVVDGLLVGEIVALCPAPDGAALVVLDKRGDLYRLEVGARTWSVARAIDQRRASPNPVYVSITTDGERLYILDSSYSQVWLQPAGEAGDGYLPGGDAPWQRAGTDLDLTEGMAIAVAGDVYVLLREGGGSTGGVARFAGSPPTRDASFAAGLEVADPVALAVGPEGTLALIDEGGRRLRLIAPSDGTVVAAPDVPADAPPMRAACLAGERLYVSAAGALYAYPGTGASVAVGGAQGPAQRPDDEGRLSAVAVLASPLAGAQYLPARDSLLPGSTRVYRYGIHRGLDMYDGTMGVAVPYGAPVLAAAAGVVVRADHQFAELTTTEYHAITAECERLHHTPDDLLDRLRGRQVWLDHGGGLVTRYVHLSAIAAEVQVGATVGQGQVIGSVGNSGTSEGVAATQSGAHLHFEVLLDGDYLGKWLSLPEVRRVLQSIIAG